MYTLYRKYMQYGSLLRTHPEPMAWLKLEHKLAYGRLIFGHIIISLNSRRFLKWRLNEQHANWRSATTATSWMIAISVLIASVARFFGHFSPSYGASLHV